MIEKKEGVIEIRRRINERKEKNKIYRWVAENRSMLLS